MYLKFLHGIYSFYFRLRRIKYILTDVAGISSSGILNMTLNLTVMGLCLLGSASNAQAQLFEQDFSSGTNINTYMGSPVTNQKLDTIYASGGASVNVITAGYSKLNMDLTSGGNAGFVRNTDFADIPNDIMYQFDLDVAHTNPSTITSVAFWEFGNNFSLAPVQSANAHSRLFLNLDSSGQYSLSYLNPMMSMFYTTSSFSGKQHITWVINHGPAVKSYLAPDGSIETVGVDKEDVWIGNTKAFDELVAISPTESLTDFNFHASTANAIIDFSHMLIDPIPNIPTSLPPTNITSSGFTANWLPMVGCNAYRVDVATDALFNIMLPGYSNVLVNGQASNQLSVTGLNPLTPYYYRVRAVSKYSFSEIAGDYSVTQTGTTLCLPPSTPSGFIQVGSFNACGSTQLAYPAGIPPVRYYWQNQLNGNSTVSPSDGLPNFTVSGSGTYYIRALDTSTQCWSANSLSSGPIVIHPLPTLVSMQGGGLSLCSDPIATTPITLKASNGTPPYTFFYTVNNGVTQSISTSPATDSVILNVPLNISGTFNYQLNGISDSNGCYTSVVSTAALVTVHPSITSGAISVSETSGNVSNDGLICNGASVTLTATGGTSYVWSSSSSNNLSSLNTLTQSPTATTTYSVTIVNINGTCSQTVTKTITVNALPSATLSGDTTVCLNSVSPAITFIGSNTIAPYQFTYNVGSGANQLVNTTGTNTALVFAPTVNVGNLDYHLISVKDALGCVQSIADTVTITIPAQPIGQFTAPLTETFCTSASGSTTINLSSSSLFPPFTYSYNLNGNTDTLPSGVSSIPLSLATSGTNVYNLVSIKNSLGCTNYSTPSTKTVNVTSALTITINAQDHTGLSLTDGVVCEGDSMILTANGGSTYSWNTGDSAQSIVVRYDSINQNNSRVYTVTSQSGNGICTGSQTITVYRKPSPSATIAGSTALCSDPVATTPIIMKGSNGILPYTFRYTLNNGPTQQITTTGLSDSVVLLIPINVPGTYTYALVSIKDSNGCETGAIGSAIITVNPSVTAGTISITETSGNVSNDGLICNGASVTLTATGGMSYVWSSSSSNNLSSLNTLTQSPTATTTYSVTIGNINGTCSQTVTKTITVNALPSATISGDTTVCLNSVSPAITFIGSNTIAPYQFTYNVGSGANQLANTTGTNTALVFAPTVNVGNLDYHLISVKDALGCEQLIADTVTITIPSQPIGQFDNPAVETYCANPGGSTNIQLSSTSSFPPFTYTYNVNGSTVTLASGVYSIPLSLATSGTNVYNLVSIENSLGCINYSTPSTKTVNITSSLIVSISAQDHTGLSLTDGIICEGDSITLTANGGSLYLWNTGANTQSIVVPYAMINQNNSQIFSVSAFSGNGVCSGSTSITVGRKPAPIASISGATTHCSDPIATTPIILTGSNGIPPYTFFYTVNNGVTQSISTIGLNSSVVLNAPLNITGGFNYQIIGISDSNGCYTNVVSTSALVTVNPSVTAGTISITETSGNASNDGIICNGSGVTLTATGGTSYNWSSSSSSSLATSSTLTQSPTATTTYSVTISNINGSCSQIVSNTITVNSLPTASLFGDTTVCLNSSSPSIRFIGSNGIAPYQFTYKVGNGSNQLANTTGTDTAKIFAPTFNVGNVDYHLISVKDALGCVQLISDTVTITIPPQPIGQFDLPTTATFCTNPGDSATVQLSSSSLFPPFTYRYNLNGNTDTLPSGVSSIPLPLVNSGTYVYNLVSITNNLGCTNYSTPSTKTVNITSALSITISAQDQSGISLTDGVVCQGDSILLTVTNGGGKYLWNTGATTPSIVVPYNDINQNNSRIYSVHSWTSDSVCVDSNSITVYRNPSPVATISTISGDTIKICSSPQGTTPITFTGSNGEVPYTFYYRLNAGSLQQIQSPYPTTGDTIAIIQAPLNNPGTYNYKLELVRDNKGCEKAMNQSVTIIVDSSVTQGVIDVVDTSGNSPNDGVICAGAQVKLKASANGGVKFDWTTSLLDSILVSPNSDTTYTVTITNGNGTCGQTLSRNITVNNNPIMGTVTSPSALCEGATSTIDVPLTNGLTPYQLQYTINSDTTIQSLFSANSMTQIPINTVNTINDTVIYHFISVSDANGCRLNLDSIQYQTKVRVNHIPNASISGNDTKCLNSGSSIINLSGTNGVKPYQFTYRLNNQTNDTITTTSSTAIATVVAPNTVVGNFNYYLLSVKDSNNCVNTNLADTVTVKVTPLPSAVISAPDIVCAGDNSNVVLVGSNGSGDYIFNYLIDGSPFSMSSISDTVKLSIPSTSPANFAYVLTGVTDANLCTTSYNDLKVVKVSSLPIGALQSLGDTTPCIGTSGTSIELKGIAGIKPYTFTYSRQQNSNSPISFISTAGNLDSTLTIAVPTAAADSFQYKLMEIKDSVGCKTTYSSSINTATIAIKPLPNVTISGDDTICVGGSSPEIKFSPSGATSPYTINYSVNPGGASSLMIYGLDTTLKINNAAAGNYVYNLSNVVDANGCAQTISGTAAAKVNSLPYATTTLLGSSNVCQGGAEPVIILTGFSGTQPYKFTYSINNGNQVNVSTSLGVNAKQIYCSTDSSGQFIYNLINVSDSNQCSALLNIKDTIRVNRKPSMGLSVSTPTLCENAGSPNILLTGSLGQPPYHFYYRDQSIPKDIYSGLSDSVYIPLTPSHGIYYFSKDSVVDANQCSSGPISAGPISLIVNQAPPKPWFTVGLSDSIHKGYDTITLCKGSSNLNFSVYQPIDSINYRWTSIQPNGVNIQSAFSEYATLSFFESGIRNIWVTSRTDSNCLDSVNLVVKVEESDTLTERKIILKQPGNLLIYPDNSMDATHTDVNNNVIHGYQWGRDTILNSISNPKQLGASKLIPGKILPVFIPDSEFLTTDQANLDTLKYAFWVMLYKDGCSTKVYYNGPYSNRSIPVAEQENETATLSVYPNPNNGEFNLHVQGDVYGKLEVNVVNGLGQSVFQTRVLKKYPDATFPLNLSELPAGIYVMQLTGLDQQHFMVKIIIQH